MSQDKRLLIVVTSHDTLGSTGKETGFYLSEVTHPYDVFTRAGIAVDFVSPKGGKAPMTGTDVEDPLNKAFLDDSDLVGCQASFDELKPSGYPILKAIALKS